MSLHGLETRLATLQESATQLRDLIDRLANLEFEPGSVPLAGDEENSPSAELGVEIGQILRAGFDEQELLQEEARYARPEGREKARLKEGIQKVGGQLNSLRVMFRRARLVAKKKLEHAQKEERKLLVRSLAVPECESPVPGADDATSPVSTIRRSPRHGMQQSHLSLSQQERETVGASGDVTAALRRTHDLMAAELSRSEFAHQTLTESSAALKQLNESYLSLDTMLASSRDSLGTLLRSQKSDTWYLQTTLYMLMATAAWLLFRRILYGPLWWLMWLPLRTLFGVGTKAGGAVLRGRGSAGQSATVPTTTAGHDGRIPVDGLPDDDLPIAQVTHEARDPHEVDLEAVVEKAREMAAEMSSAADEQEESGEATGTVDDTAAPEAPAHAEDEILSDMPGKTEDNETAGEAVETAEEKSATGSEEDGGEENSRDEL